MGLPVILGIAGTAIGAFSSISQGMAASADYAYKAQVAKYNATAAIQEGGVQATNQSLATRARIGQIKAGQAAAGVDVNSGSAADVSAAQAGLGELDALTIRSNAARRAYGYSTEANLDESSSANAKTAGIIGGISSIVSGASSTYKDYAAGQLAVPGTQFAAATPSDFGVSTAYSP